MSSSVLGHLFAHTWLSEGKVEALAASLVSLYLVCVKNYFSQQI